MKKTKIFKGLLLVSIAALTFVACGKKNTKITNKTTGNKTQITTNNNTTDKKTTQKQITTAKKEIQASNKCYVSNEGIIVKADVEAKKGLTDLKICFTPGKYMICKTNIADGKFVSSSFFSNDSFTPEMVKVVKNSDKFTPVAILSVDLFEGYTGADYNITANVSDDKITIYFMGTSYSIGIDGTISNEFSEVTKNGSVVTDKLYKFENNILTITNKDNENDVYRTLKLEKDTFQDNCGEDEFCTKYNSDGTITSYYYEDDEEEPSMHYDKTITLDSEGYIKSLDSGKKVIDYVYSSDRKTLSYEVVPFMTIAPLKVIKNYKIEFKFDDYGRLLESNLYMAEADDYALTSTESYTYDAKGNSLIKGDGSFKYRYEYTYNENDLITRSNTLLIDEDDHSKYSCINYSLYTYDNIGRETTYKYYEIKNGGIEILKKDLELAYQRDKVTHKTFLFYEDDGKFDPWYSSYKSVYLYDDLDRRILEEQYRARHDNSELYMCYQQSHTFEENGTRKITTVITKDLQEDSAYDTITKTVYTTDTNYKKEDYYDFKDGNYVISLSETEEIMSDGTKVNTTISYNNGDLQRSYEETFKIVDGESEIIKTSEEIYYASGSRTKVNEYYYDTEAIGEIVPTKQQMKYESFLFNESNKLIHYSIRIYYYVDNNRYEKSTETRDWNESVNGYIDRSTTYTHTHFIGEKQIEKVKILNSSFQLQKDMMYDYLYDEDTNEYTRQVSIYNSYLEEYELDSVELFTGADYSSIHDEDFIMIIEFVHTGGTDNWLCRMIEYKYNDQGKVVETFTTEYEKTGAESNYVKSVITYDTDGVTQLKETVYASNTTKNNLVKTAEYIFIGDNSYTTFIGLIDENNYYDSLGLGTINSDGRYEKVVHLTFNANTYVIASAILYENDLSDIEHIKSQKWLLNNAELQVEFTDEIIDRLFDTSNYAKDGDPEFRYRQL